MKHIKLFEDFGSMETKGLSLVKVISDWSGIRRDSKPEMFVFPSSVNVEYYPNPTEQQIRDAAYDESNQLYQSNFGHLLGYPANHKIEITDVDFDRFIENSFESSDEVVDEILSGDQNGVNLYQRNPMYILVDSRVSPREIENGLKEAIINSADDALEYIAEDILDEPSEYTPEFISHCQHIVDGSGKPINRQLNFSIK